MNFSISRCRFSPVLEGAFPFRQRSIHPFERISSTALSYLSPKQTVRPEPFSETFQEVAFKIRMNLAFRLWRMRSLFDQHLLPKEGAEYLKILKILATDQKEITDKESVGLIALLSHIGNKNYLNKFDFHIALSNDSQVQREHKILKDIFILFDPLFFSSFKNKLQNLLHIEDIDKIGPLLEKDRLSLNDINMINGVDAAKNLLKKLDDYKITGIDDFRSKLEELEVLIHYPFFDKLKHLCQMGRPPGTIFLGDRRTLKVLNGNEFNCSATMRHLFMGRICHIGILLNKEEKGLHLSHVNRITKNHAVLPIKNPLSLPFSYSLPLDIKPLIPSSLPETQKEELISVFFTEFERLASEEHPEFPLAKTKRYIKMLVMGHKTLFPNKLSKVDFPEKNTPLMCSSYVAIVFLKAIQKMNLFLEEQGRKERIPHPFGQHENLMNMDILRLLYLWKNLRVIKPPLAPHNSQYLKFFYLTPS